MKKVFLTMACLFMVIALISCGGSAKQLTDQEILVKIYEGMNGTNWTEYQRENWLSDKPIGEWKNVTVNDSGRVISLRIQGDSVRGLIPAEIGGLTELEQLYIYSKSYEVANVLPAEIGKLTKLKILGLSIYSNSEKDKPVLPDLSTLVNLEAIYLSGLHGAIPENIGQLSKLKILQIEAFEGKIPESVCELANLEQLTLRSGVQPEGEVPDCIGRLSKLKSLTIDHSNGIAGGIEGINAKFPESIWDLTNLETLFMRSLSNTGNAIPGDKVAKMANLKTIVINNCGITGPIPVELFASGKLTNLSIYQNNLTGSIPAEIGNCPGLNMLMLNKNQLTGNIPAELAKCEKFNIFDLSDNELSPNIPAALKAHSDFSKFRF